MPDFTPKHRVKILDKAAISHDVNRWTVEKPDGYTFVPGQATHLALDLEGYRDADRPFTFSSLPNDPTLEFVIKTYPQRDGVTDKLDDVQPGQYLLLDDAAGGISYRGEGTFIAGGAGVTPFLAIFRQLMAENKMGNNRLLFANKTADDIFLKTELEALLGDNIVHVLSDEDAPFAHRGIINKAFLQAHCSGFDSQCFYLCGPPGMGEGLREDLMDLGASDEKIIHENWD